MKLSKLQNQAFNEIKDFLKSTDNIYILKGYAGTGKTFLISELIKFFNKNDVKYLAAAPTGKAARILAHKCACDVKTLHSLIYKLDDENMALEDQSSFNFLLKNSKFEEFVLIVDEASMLTDSPVADNFLNFGTGSLLRDLFDFFTLYDFDLNNKIIFVGDPAQLPPINNTFSPALDCNYLSDNFDLNCQEFTLTEIFRQSKESGILTNAFNIREAIESNFFESFVLDENENVKRLNNNFDFNMNLIENEIKRNSTIVISYTNRVVHRYNIAIRQKVNRSKDLPDLIKGDKLLVTTNNQLYDMSNGDILEVINFDDHIEKRIINDLTLEFVDAEVKYADFGKTNYEVKLLLNLLKNHERAITFEERNAIFSLSKDNLDVPYPMRTIRNKKNPRYDEQIKEFKEALRESPYYNALQVKYGYAITGHKAQGGEWDTVFVDFTGFKSIDDENFYRWVYTSITRAKNRLYLINSPHANY